MSEAPVPERWLLDSSALIALLVNDHLGRETVIRWVTKHPRTLVFCPITQQAFLRFFLRTAEIPDLTTAQNQLRALTRKQGVQFVPADLDATEISPFGIRGHRQLTDAYLIELARRHNCRLATLDDAQAGLNPGICELIR